MMKNKKSEKKSVTYGDLKKILEKMPPELLSKRVIIWTMEESIENYR